MNKFKNYNQNLMFMKQNTIWNLVDNNKRFINKIKNLYNLKNLLFNHR